MGTAATAGGPQGTSATMLAPFVEELDKLAPSFKLHGSRIRIIQTPADFYETLKDKIRHAERRIFLSTLYIGKSEKDLIATLQTALRTKPDLKLSILADALRGTRESPDPCAASLLAPLVTEFGPERVEIRMYHTPNLTGMRKKFIPNRINEGWGLQHMKLYGFDDEIILSGANLSTDYFTNRQDRYHMFSSRDITSYFWGLQEAVCSLSFLVRPSSESASGFVLDWPTSNKAPSPLENSKQFVADSTKLLRGLISAGTPPQICGGGNTPNNSLANMTQTQRHAKPPSQDTGEAPPDTSVYILAQMSQLLRPDSSTEQPALTHVLSTLASSPAGLARGSSWTFTAGYFNPAPSLTRLLLATVPAGSSGTVITASPYANGFYRSRGVSGMLPDAYSLLSRRFLDSVERQRRRIVEEGGSGGGNRGENLPTAVGRQVRHSP
ncbi:CDP-diacylglycerol-glycerol-3-phosphate 3-phosphatidyltransferase [Magnaporthiopsis poae ATCC 64411]|uniref:CDP-diacylglycerol--glycerol-3-phosphate 3-phosphatidyltransferase n=1 Tax=Magnaporthiopsis poae (strain ATCC 64411 / 73-15) TaxID=644358 RepID=A0A0C4E950_MAGP6|nr:CDP-diacylglycerol-glycerol-3-phosphate 3-phosphatidyltransferase [Magnaporthiopsis poae ATCC 64411]